MKTDVCLVSPAGRANEPRLPLGLMYIAACLEREMLITEIVDVKISPYKKISDELKQKIDEEIIAKIIKIEPAIVGITCLVTEVNEVLDICREVKRKLKDTKTVVGGIHPTMYPEDFLYENSPVDYVVLGEGEYTTCDLVKAIQSGSSIEDVAGIALFDGKKLHRTKQRSVIKNLDEIPFPAYEKVDMEYYTKPSIYAIRTMLLSTLHIFTSRGCPYQCTFCVNKNLAEIMNSKTSVRSRSVKNVIDEIEYLARRYKIDGFYIYDDTFALKKDYVDEFCRELLARKLGLIWAAETRVNLISKEMIKTMSDAGCVQLDFGVESGSQQILDRIKKGIKISDIKNIFRVCRELGVRTFANFMFNTPGETEDDVKKTYALAREIKAHNYNFGITTPFPGTDLYDNVRPRLTVAEYHLFATAKNTLADPRFKLAKHDLNLEKLAKNANVICNSVWKRMSFVFDAAYMARVMKSSRKMEYVLAIFSLIGLALNRVRKGFV